MTFNAALSAHLGTGTATTCHAWAITRQDGTILGFTDHDEALAFEGITFRADSGLTAAALQQNTGLAVDNTEALGALSDAAISEADIEAGRYDGAEVIAWLVNWQDPDARQVIFRGTIGEMSRSGGAFRAELRGLAEVLNRPLGRVFQRPCGAVLGDVACGVDLGQPGLHLETSAISVTLLKRLSFAPFAGFAEGWFARGRLVVLDGPAAGLSAPIKSDVLLGGTREIELWTPLRMDPGAGAQLRLEAGCDKRFETCREKFDNGLNFRGFPDLPGEDWLTAGPGGGDMTGGSRR